MSEKEFLEMLARKVLAALKPEEHSGHELQISKIGHFSRKLFSPEKMFKCSARTIVRLSLNIAMELGEKETDKLAKILYEDFKKAAFEVCGTTDQINREHESKKKTAKISV